MSTEPRVRNAFDQLVCSFYCVFYKCLAQRSQRQQASIIYLLDKHEA